MFEEYGHAQTMPGWSISIGVSLHLMGVGRGNVTDLVLFKITRAVDEGSVDANDMDNKYTIAANAAKILHGEKER